MGWGLLGREGKRRRSAVDAPKFKTQQVVRESYFFKDSVASLLIEWGGESLEISIERRFLNRV
jgi:hypothetical protein